MLQKQFQRSILFLESHVWKNPSSSVLEPPFPIWYPSRRKERPIRPLSFSISWRIRLNYRESQSWKWEPVGYPRLWPPCSGPRLWPWPILIHNDYIFGNMDIGSSISLRPVPSKQVSSNDQLGDDGYSRMQTAWLESPSLPLWFVSPHSGLLEWPLVSLPYADIVFITALPKNESNKEEEPSWEFTFSAAAAIAELARTNGSRVVFIPPGGAGDGRVLDIPAPMDNPFFR